MTQMPMPFQQVTEAHVALGLIPNMEGAIAARPDTLPDEQTWERLAQRMFAGELTAEQDEELNDLIRDEYSDMASDMYRYVKVWSQSISPSLEEKLRVTGWCLSQLLREPPSFLRV